jgi:uncharacterized protein with FMN-binding domain
VGSQGFVENVQTLLDTKALIRKAAEMVDKHTLGGQSARYNTISGAENSGLSLGNRRFWEYFLMESMS